MAHGRKGLSPTIYGKIQRRFVKLRLLGMLSACPIAGASDKLAAEDGVLGAHPAVVHLHTFQSKVISRS